MITANFAVRRSWKHMALTFSQKGIPQKTDTGGYANSALTTFDAYSNLH